MSSVNDNVKLVWSGVCFQRKIFALKPQPNLPGRNIKRQFRRATFRPTMKPVNKNLISSRISMRRPSMFYSNIQHTDEEESQKNVLPKTGSGKSFSSYGMMSPDSHSGPINLKMSLPDLPKDQFYFNFDGLNPAILEDLKNKPSASDLLEAYVNDQILKKKPKMRLYEDFDLSDMYQKCITKSFPLDLFIQKDLSYLPDYLKDVIVKHREIGATQLDEVKAKSGINFARPSSKDEDDFFSRHRPVATYAYPQKSDIMRHIDNENLEFKRFFHPLLLEKTYNTTANEDMIQAKDADKISGIVDEVTAQLFMNNNKPDSESRRFVLTVLKSAKVNLLLLQEIGGQVDLWFDALLNGLFSKFRTVVEDTCVIIAFICYQPLLARAIIDNEVFDVGKDTVTALLRAMELKPIWYSVYSFALAFIIGCCQRFSILEVLYEKVHMSKQYIILANWPHFIFYASQFWKTVNLVSNHVMAFKIVQFLEFCFLKKLSLRPAKRALISYCKRCSINSKLVTLWPGKQSINMVL